MTTTPEKMFFSFHCKTCGCEICSEQVLNKYKENDIVILRSNIISRKIGDLDIDFEKLKPLYGKKVTITKSLPGFYEICEAHTIITDDLIDHKITIVEMDTTGQLSGNINPYAVYEPDLMRYNIGDKVILKTSDQLGCRFGIKIVNRELEYLINGGNKNRTVVTIIKKGYDWYNIQEAQHVNIPEAFIDHVATAKLWYDDERDKLYTQKN